MQDPNGDIDKSPQNAFEEDEDVEVEQLVISDEEQDDNSNVAISARRAKEEGKGDTTS